MDPQVLREAMTAYQAVYDEDLRETIEFENWVNALLDEGYDLSDYTWEDMYEAYLGEQGVRTGSNPNVFKPTPSSPGSRRGAAPVPSSSSSGSVSTPRGRVTGSNANNTFSQAERSGGTRRGAAAGTRPSPTANRPAPAPTPRPPATAAPRPGTPAAPRPPATAAPRPGTPAAPRPTATSPTKPAPTASSNTMQTAGRNLTGTGALAPAPKKPSLASQAAELRAMRTASQQRQGLTQGFDMFDVVKGHLLDEGYADTEEAALAIMANMSEEWKNSILKSL
jgi:hypothetical protein